VNEENLEKSDGDPISERPTISVSMWNLGKPRKTQSRYPLFWARFEHGTPEYKTQVLLSIIIQNNFVVESM